MSALHRVFALSVRRHQASTRLSIVGIAVNSSSEDSKLSNFPIEEEEVDV